MTGANYMGGRRNAAKARSRDKTGRLQRDFFGRRRLNILSKGLGVLPSFGEGALGGQNSLALRTSIDLGHAKKLSPSQGDDRMAGSIPSAPGAMTLMTRKRKRGHKGDIGVGVLSTPRSNQFTRTGSPAKSSSSIKVTKSKLLQQLDLYEPISSDAAISCILSMPDLAGLSSCKKPPSKRLCLDPPNHNSAPNDHESISSEEEGGEEEDEIVDSDFEPSSGLMIISLKEYQASSMSGSRSAVVYNSSGHSSKGVVELRPPETPHIASKFAQSNALYDFSPSSNRDWSLLGGSPSATKHSEDDEISSISSFTSAASGKWYPLPTEGQLVNGTSHSDQTLSRATTSDLEEAAEGDHPKNLLNYSDPWEQLGVILGLPKDFRAHETSWTWQGEEVEAPDGPAAVESDLPPSDIPCDESLDGTHSSLPVAESSDKIKTPSNATGSCGHIFWDDFESNLSDLDPGQNLVDAISLQNPDLDILPLSDSLVDSDSKTKVSIVSPSKNNVGTMVGHGVVLLEGMRQGSTLKEVDQRQSPRKQSNLAALVVCGGERDQVSPQLPSAVFLRKEKEVKQPPQGRIPWEDSAQPSPEPENIPRDGDIREKGNGGRHSAEAIRLIIHDGHLASPKLLEDNGVYQGPCLLSDESEYSDLEA